MTSMENNNHPLETGTYIIQSLNSNTNVNLVVQVAGEDPRLCVWKTTRSPTELWHLEAKEKGYIIRNLATDLYMSYPLGVKEKNGVPINGVNRPVEWAIEKTDDYFSIKLVSLPEFSLDVSGYHKRDGSGIEIYSFHGKSNQQWQFQRVDDKQLPSSNVQTYIGAVPVGIYWLGQPHEGGGIEKARKEPSRAALTVAAGRPLKGNVVTSAHLSPVGVEGPCSNQIWSVEAGLHGYRLRNVGTESFLNCVDRVPVVVSGRQGLAGVTEWTLKKDPPRDKEHIPDYWIRPSSDYSLILGVTRGYMFNQAHLKSLSDFQENSRDNWCYTQWRFEAVDEQLLDDPENLHPCVPETANPSV